MSILHDPEMQRVLGRRQKSGIAVRQRGQAAEGGGEPPPRLPANNEIQLGGAVWHGNTTCEASCPAQGRHPRERELHLRCEAAGGGSGAAEASLRHTAASLPGVPQARPAGKQVSRPGCAALAAANCVWENDLLYSGAPVHSEWAPNMRNRVPPLQAGRGRAGQRGQTSSAGMRQQGRGGGGCIRWQAAAHASPAPAQPHPASTASAPSTQHPAPSYGSSQQAAHK